MNEIKGISYKINSSSLSFILKRRCLPHIFDGSRAIESEREREREDPFCPDALYYRCTIKNRLFPPFIHYR